MTLYLRPESNVTQTNVTGGFDAIDEEIANDADFAYSANGSSAVLEVLLSPPAGTPQDGDSTLRYRVVKTANGVPTLSGQSVQVTVSLRQGATQIQSWATSVGGSWTQFDRTIDLSAEVSDWSDLRVRIAITPTGGGTARGAAVSWVVLEVPGEPASGNMLMMF